MTVGGPESVGVREHLDFRTAFLGPNQQVPFSRVNGTYDPGGHHVSIRKTHRTERPEGELELDVLLTQAERENLIIISNDYHLSPTGIQPNWSFLNQTTVSR